MEVQKRYAHGFIIMQWHTNDMPQLAYWSFYVPGSGSSNASLADQRECYSFLKTDHVACHWTQFVGVTQLSTALPSTQVGLIPKIIMSVDQADLRWSFLIIKLQMGLDAIAERMRGVRSIWKCIGSGYDEHHLWEKHIIRILVKPKYFSNISDISYTKHNIW